MLVRVGAFGLLLFACLAAMPRSGAAGARAYFVNDTTPLDGNGLSWETAFADLQDALSVAVAGDEIWVASGVYRPTVGAVRTASFVLRNGVGVYGGFAGIETARTQRDPGLNVTVLSGDLQNQGLAIDNSFHVVRAGPVSPSAILDGFTISDGNANAGGLDARGGGILSTGGSPTFANLVVTRNLASGGAGIAVIDGNARLSRVAITGNVASGDGGGIRIEDGTPELKDVTVVENTSGGSGGGLDIASGEPTLVNLDIQRNVARLDGGGLYVGDGHTWIESSIISSNTAASDGGGIFATDALLDVAESDVSGNRALFGGGLYAKGANVKVSAATFAGNVAGRGGGLYLEESTTTGRDSTISANDAGGFAGGLYLEGGDTRVQFFTFAGNTRTAVYNDAGFLEIRRSIVWGNPGGAVLQAGAPSATTDIDSSVIEGGCSAPLFCGPIIAASDPHLQPLASNGGVTRTHALLPASSAIDLSLSSCSASDDDQRGQSRNVDGNKDGLRSCDAGAFEFQPAAPLVAFKTSVSGGKESVGTVKIPVVLSTTAVSDVTVKYAVSGGSATPGTDFVLAAGTLTFPKLSNGAQFIELSVTNDPHDEPTEDLVITLSSPSGAALGARTAHTYRIQDDDPRVTCRGRIPTLIGTSGKDVLAGTKGPDVILGGDGDDIIDGAGGDDVICAGPGNDLVTGGSGNDSLVGQPGDDNLSGGAGVDDVLGGPGADVLAGGPNAGDYCAGGPGKDILAPAAGCESKTGVP